MKNSFYILATILVLVHSQTNADRRIKKVTLSKSKQFDDIPTQPQPSPQSEPPLTQSELQKDCDLKEPSLKRDYACLELSVLSLDSFDIKVLKTISNTIVLVKAQAIQQKHKALGQVNRLMSVQRHILDSKQKILAMGCKYLCGEYTQIYQDSPRLFYQDDITDSFTNEYVMSFGRYSNVISQWRSSIVIRSGWSGIRKHLFSYFDWNVQTYYPYYYSMYWTSSNGLFFTSNWFNTHVLFNCLPLYSLMSIREPSLLTNTSQVQSLQDNELNQLVQTTNDLQDNNNTTDDKTEEDLEDQLNKGTLDSAKLRSTFQSQEESLENQITAFNQDDKVEEDKEEKEEREMKEREQQVRAEEEKRNQEHQQHKLQQEQEEEQKQKNKQNDMFNLGKDLDSLNSNNSNEQQQENKESQQEDTTGCDQVVDNEFDVEPCDQAHQEYCITFCIKSEGMRKVQGVSKQMAAQNKEDKDKSNQQFPQNNNQPQQHQQQGGNDFGGDMFGRLQKVNKSIAGKLVPNAKDARLQKEQVQEANLKIAANNNQLLSKIASLLGNLGDSMDEKPTKNKKHHHHHHRQ